MSNLDWHQWDSHKQRLVTGFSMLIPLLLLLGLGPLWTLCVAVVLAAAAGLWEFQGLLSQEGLPRWWQAFYFSAGLSLPLGAALGGATGLHCALVLGLFCGLFCLLAFSPLDSTGVARLAQLSFGWLYIPYLLSYLLLIGHMEAGRTWIFFIATVIVTGDSAAFYSGRNLGRHKLYEQVSPKKTIEGSLGGLLGSVVMGTLFGYFFVDNVSVGELVLLSGVLALVGQVGDLMESMIKRMSGKKDASQLLPGHGGVLDRLDSLLFAFPAVWLFLMWKH